MSGVFEGRAERGLRHNSSRVTVAASALQAALPALRQKLAGHIGNFVAMVEI